MNDLKGPGLFEIKEFIKDKSLIEFHTVNGKVLKGSIAWFDTLGFHLILENGQEITLIKESVIYYQKV